MTRSQEREQAFILLFEKSFNEDVSPERLIELSLDSEVTEKSDFTSELFLTACEHQSDADEIIGRYAKGRSFSRISKVSLAVLRLAVTEIKFIEGIPSGVSINEAVELCKKYASEDEYSYVNGILGSIVKDEAK